MKKRLSLILCVVLLCQLLSGCGKTTETVREPDDAYRCYYEIFVGSFCDSDGDKCGDLSGITEKLDYIEDMGFTGIWLTPIMPSPTYHKYDATDYYGIDPSFGTMEDFETLLKECHKRNIRLIDHVLSINRADITVMRGNFTTWQQEKDREDQFELQQNEKLKKDVKRLEAAARRSAEWSNRAEDRKIGFKPERTEKALDRRAYEGEKSRKMMKRAKSIESRRNDALEEKSALLKNIESADTKLQIATLRHPKDLLVEANDLSIDYGDGPIFPPLRFEIRRGDRAALQGKNGCGKSSIIKLLCGEDVPHTGTLKTASGLVVSYIPQSAEGLSGTLRDYAEHCGIDESLFKSILRKLEFQRTQFEKRMEDFSEGQKKKVLIARSLCEKAHLLVWDEPLNFIDVISRMQLETLLKECVPTVIFVEHDRRFVENVATKIIRL